MFEQAFKNIDDVLWKDAGCTSELDYTEQTSWLLFLKYLDALEHDKATEAALDGKKYTHILDLPYRWESWAAPKGKDGKIDHNTAGTGDDLVQFVNAKLFPYLHGFKARATGPNTIDYKIGEIFGEIKNRIQSRYNLREMQKIIEAEKSDLFDVLAHVDYALPPLTRERRAEIAKIEITTHFNTRQRVFLAFVLSHYVTVGVDELASEKLTPLLRLRYHDSLNDAVADLGQPDEIQRAFSGFQKYLYQRTGS